MPEPYLRSKSSSSSGRSSRSSSGRKSSGSSSSRKSSSSKSGSSKTSSSRSKAAAASKKKSAKKKTTEKQPIRARPALLYGLVLACVVAIGATSIKAIHASTPMADGFDVVTTESANGSTGAAGANDPVAPPMAADLMRKQGWVAPASLQLYERERRRSVLPPEIAAVPETLIEVEVIKPEGGGYAPPPPIAGATLGGDTLQGQTFPSEDAVPLQTDDPTAQAQPQNSDEIQSMLAGINNQQRQPAPEPKQEPAQTKQQLVTLLQAQAQCADKGFIARIACNDRVREKFCTNRWNEIAGCERDEDADF